MHKNYSRFCPYARRKRAQSTQAHILSADGIFSIIMCKCHCQVAQMCTAMVKKNQMNKTVLNLTGQDNVKNS